MKLCYNTEHIIDKGSLVKENKKEIQIGLQALKNTLNRDEAKNISFLEKQQEEKVKELKEFEKRINKLSVEKNIPMKKIKSTKSIDKSNELVEKIKELDILEKQKIGLEKIIQHNKPMVSNNSESSSKAKIKKELVKCFLESYQKGKGGDFGFNPSNLNKANMLLSNLMKEESDEGEKNLVTSVKHNINARLGGLAGYSLKNAREYENSFKELVNSILKENNILLYSIKDAKNLVNPVVDTEKLEEFFKGENLVFPANFSVLAYTGFISKVNSVNNQGIRGSESYDDEVVKILKARKFFAEGSINLILGAVNQNNCKIGILAKEFDKYLKAGNVKCFKSALKECEEEKICESIESFLYIQDKTSCELCDVQSLIATQKGVNKLKEILDSDEAKNIADEELRASILTIRKMYESLSKKLCEFVSLNSSFVEKNKEEQNKQLKEIEDEIKQLKQSSLIVVDGEPKTDKVETDKVNKLAIITTSIEKAEKQCDEVKKEKEGLEELEAIMKIAKDRGTAVTEYTKTISKDDIFKKQEPLNDLSSSHKVKCTIDDKNNKIIYNTAIKNKHYQVEIDLQKVKELSPTNEKIINSLRNCLNKYGLTEAIKRGFVDYSCLENLSEASRLHYNNVAFKSKEKNVDGHWQNIDQTMQSNTCARK
jgi:hypothetical protein